MALAVAALLASLSLVTWRQSRALEALAELQDVRRDVILAQAEVAELGRRIQYLESRSHVEPAARDVLGMHMPRDGEIVLLSGDGP